MLRERLTSSGAFDVLAATADADAALDTITKRHPDAAVLDIDMPGRNPFEVATVIRAFSPRTGVLFLSSHYSDRYIQQAIDAGARGYVVKTRTPDEIIDSIKIVATGGVSFSQEVLDRLIIDSRGVRLASPVATRLNQLSERELECLRYIAQGLSKKEVAEKMHLSVKTIQNHTDRLMQKLDIHDRVELTRFAIREGLLQA